MRIGMIFSSIPFLYCFLPAVILLYFVVPGRGKNVVLLLASLVFYAWGELRYTLLMLVMITQGYVFGRLIDSKRRWSKLFLTTSVVISLGVLGYFKYAGFFLESFGAVTGLAVPVLKVTLPIGISFYTFQVISYVIDVYRKTVAAQRSYIDMAMYISMFPQLIAGPIVRYSDIEGELHVRKHSAEKTACGIRRFIIGLSKKVLIANQLGELIDAYAGASQPSVLFVWLYAIACTLQIYFDFSGYSDMAIGLGKIFGFDFPENFNYPYISKSITEFWRRWHMSLSFWVKDYLYLPLSSGMRRWGQWGVFLSLSLTFAGLGAWHGAGWNYIIYGLIQGLIIFYEMKTATIRNKIKNWIGNPLFTTLSILRTYLLFAFSLIFFRLESVSDALYYIRNISFSTHTSWKEVSIGIPDHNCIVAGSALVLILVYEYFMSKRDLLEALEKQPMLVRWGIYYLLAIMFFTLGQFNSDSFIYLQF